MLHKNVSFNMSLKSTSTLIVVVKNNFAEMNFSWPNMWLPKRFK